MRAVMAIFFAVLVLAAGPQRAGAVNPSEVLSDPVLEARARDISQGLRCLVCQNQTIDDSDASLAKDLRVLVRERLLAGDSDQQVMAFITNRYGDFVLLKPPLKAGTLLLWFGPGAIFLLGLGALLRFFINRRREMAEDSATPKPLTEAEKKRLKSLLAEDPVESDEEGDGS